MIQELADHGIGLLCHIDMMIMTLWSKLKTGLRHPREALVYLALGPQRYHLTSAENLLVEAERMERNVRPNNLLESYMVKPTDIHEHLATLYMLSIELNLRTILELGVRGGESTITLLESAKQIKGKVYSIDIDPCLEAKAIIQTYRLQKYWTFIQGDDLKVKWDKPIDHLFIDTTHTFDGTLKELKKYEPYVRNGGVITMHDIISHPEVLHAINIYMEGREDLRIYKFFNNFGLAVIFKRI